MTATIPGPPPTVDDMDASTYLKPYVPRLVIEWLRESPREMHREVEATLVFVDISGFTALTERLARKGKVGAEIMRDTLDGVFRALLDEAYDWGAGLLKWGGDALLLNFDGPQHPERAVRAAWEMQRTINRVGRINAGGGTVVLRMSVGIGTGNFHFFMAGSVHRELLIAGPAMTETLVMEGIADAGEIGLSPTLAAMLDPAIVGGPKLTTILLAGPPQVERSRAPDVGDVSDLDIPGCIPVASRAHVLLRTSEAEHRTITAAFIDLMDTDQLLAEVGPDALALGLHERISAIEEAALRYEVPFYETDVGKSSVKALLTAGAPSSTGHDEERMLRALREVMDQPGLVPMRVGVNTGKVFTGDFGPPYRRAYRVFGDAINTAARVMAKAEAGQILSTEIVLDRSRTIFEATPIEPFAAKGKAALVHASLVGPVLGLKETKRDDVGLIGREGELEQLLGVIQAARDGRGGIIEIAGEPGLGKSRLVEELVGRSSDFRILRSRCEEYEASTPYFAFRALIRGVLGVDADVEADACIARLWEHVGALDASLVPWTPLLGILLGLDIPGTPETAALDERFLRDRLAEIALQFLYLSLRGRPSIFVIEDVQFLDEASRDLLQRLSMAATDVRQVLLVTRQGSGTVFDPDDAPDDDGEKTPITTLELGPLPIRATIAIIEAATEADPLRPHEVEAIAERSGGNTLFLFELLETVRATGTIEALPDSIESLIAGEIDHLAPTDRTIVRYAAVLGPTFDPDLLEAAVRADMDLDEGLWDRLDDLIETEPGGDRRFRNTLIRDAAYEGLPYRRRRALHERVAETIETRAGEDNEDQTAILAFHYHEAQRWDKSWQYSREAGDRAMAIYANVEATRLYEKAIEAGRRQRAVSARDLATIAERSSDALYRLGEFSNADRALRAAMRWRGNDPIEIAPLVVKQAIIDTRSASYRRAVDRVLRALGHLEGVRGRSAAASRSRLMVEVAAVRFLQNRRVESIAWCKRAIPEARRGGAIDAEAQAYKVLDGALIENGEVAKTRYSGRALELFREIGDLRNQVLVLNNLGVIEHEKSNWDRSRKFYFEALELADVIGDRSMGALAKFNVSDILIDQGRYDDAEPLLREAIRVWRASGADADVAEGQRERARLMARRREPGDIDEARQLLESAREEQTSAGKSGEVLLTDSRMAELEVLAGRSAVALEIAERGLIEAERTEGGSLVVPRFERTRGWALLQSGRSKEALEAFRRAERLARRGEDFNELAQALDGIVEVRRSFGRPWQATAAERDAIYRRIGIIAPVQVPIADKVTLSA
jgi:class 3 adenylate cyclase/tetratricopeptide (TPR) repeat protein